MKSISVALLAHNAQEVTTLCNMWKVTRKDGAVYTFTDASHDITYSDGYTYLASSGFTASNITTTDQLSVDNLEVNSILTSATITDADLLAGLWDYASITIFRVNYNDLTMGAETMRTGTIGEVSTGRTAFVAELRGLTQYLQQNIGRIIAAACDANLGDSRCTVNLASFTVTGTVTGVTSNSLFADSGRAEASGYFTGGLLTWTSGLNNTYQKEVKVYTTGSFELTEPMPNAIQVGDTYSVYAGCDKLHTTCGTKFSNIVNFRGFPFVPGRDRLVSGT